LDDDAVLVRCEGDFTKPLLVYVYLLDLQDTRTRDADSITDRNSLRPSVPPSSGSEQRSGCGIIPSTLPRLLVMPAMLWRDPLGFAQGRNRPPGSPRQKQ